MILRVLLVGSLVLITTLCRAALQVEKYLMRPNAEMASILDAQTEPWRRFTSPLVG